MGLHYEKLIYSLEIVFANEALIEVIDQNSNLAADDDPARVNRLGSGADPEPVPAFSRKAVAKFSRDLSFYLHRIAVKYRIAAASAVLRIEHGSKTRSRRALTGVIQSELLSKSTPGTEQQLRAEKRSEWIDKQMSLKGWRSDEYIHTNGGPTNNTIKRVRSGKESRRDDSVKEDFAKAFGVRVDEIPW